jgi:hypothetical protein
VYILKERMKQRNNHLHVNLGKNTTTKELCACLQGKKEQKRNDVPVEGERME